MRVFFAIYLPQVAEGVRAVQQHLIGDLRLTPPESLHITLHFLGEVSPNELEPWKERARRIKAQPFTVTVGGELMGFPRRENWRALCAPVEDAGRSIHLLHRGLGGSGSSSNFRPHVTVARCSHGSPRVPSLVLPTVEVVVTGFHLLESQLTRTGAVYTSLGHYPLK